MVSVCLPSDALSQHLPSYLGFSYLGCGVSLHGCSSKVQPLLLTLDKGYLLTTAPPDLERGVAPLGAPVPAQPPLLRRGVAPLGHRPWPRAWGSSSQLPPLTSGVGWLLSATLLHGLSQLAHFPTESRVKGCHRFFLTDLSNFLPSQGLQNSLRFLYLSLR